MARAERTHLNDSITIPHESVFWGTEEMVGWVTRGSAQAVGLFLLVFFWTAVFGSPAHACPHWNPCQISGDALDENRSWSGNAHRQSGVSWTGLVFEVFEGAEYRITVPHGYNHGGVRVLDPDFYLKDASGVIIGEAIYGSVQSRDRVITYTANETGIHKLEIKHQFGNLTRGLLVHITRIITPPQIELTTPREFVNAEFDVNVEFTQAVTGVDSGDFEISNGTLAGFTGTGPYTLTINPASEGEVTVALRDTGTDIVNATLDAVIPASITVEYDITPPAPTGTSSAPALVNAPFMAEFNFGEPVINITSSDFAVTNGVVSSLAQVSQSIYRVTIAPGVDGEVSVAVEAGGYEDRATNLGLASAPVTRTYDGTPPAVTLSSSAPSAVRDAIDVTIAFSEQVQGFVPANLSLVNASVVSLDTLDDQTFTARVQPQTDGPFEVRLDQARVSDLAGNLNLAAPDAVSRIYDSVAPSVTLAREASDPVSGRFDVRITFSEIVEGFHADAITVVNATLGALLDNGNGIYVINVRPEEDGLVEVSLPAGAAVDLAGNQSLASETLSTHYDRTPPVAALSSTAPMRVRGDFEVLLSFTEAVIGFQAEHVDVSNGESVGFESADPAQYVVTIRPEADGEVVVSFPAGRVVDAAGNTNLASPNTVSRVFDSSRPRATLMSSAAPAIAGPFQMEVEFDKPVSSLSPVAFSVTNAKLLLLSGSELTYVFEVRPLDQGAVEIYLPQGAVTDEAGNGNAESAVLARVFDTVRPTVTLSSEAGPVSGQFVLTVQFDEPVEGLAPEHLVVSNGSVTGLTGSGSTYEANISASMDGLVTVDLPANVAEDAAGNGNMAAAQFSIDSDTTAPGVEISSVSADLVSGPFTIDILFTEPVTWLESGGLAVAGGTAGPISGSGDSYSVTITPSGDGTVEVSLPEDAATDAAGNANTASNTLSREIDTVRPGVTLASTSSDPTNGPFAVTAVFTKPVFDLTEGDFDVTNGEASDLTGSGDSYSVTITPSGDGEVSVSLPDGAAEDAAGNASTASNTLSREIDTARPDVTLASTSTDPTNGPFAVTAVFTKPVFDLTEGDFDVTNGEASDLTGSGDSYSVTITPSGDGAVNVSLPDGAAEDAAGNTSMASNTLTRQIDTARPDVTLASASTDPTNGPFAVTAVFTKSVTGLAVGDFAVTNGTASDLTGSGDSYSVTITPTGDGAVSVSLPDGAAEDAAGNTSTASNTLTRQVDTAEPVLVIASPADEPVTGAFDVTFTFSKPVTGFVSEDVTVTNGSLSGFSGSAAQYAAVVTPHSDGPVSISVAAGAGTDTAGNGSLAGALSVEAKTSSPEATVIAASQSELRLADVGSNFTVTVTFSEAMDDAHPPVIEFTNANLSGTLSFQSGVFSAGGTVYAAQYSIADSGLEAAAIGVTISGARDAFGNEMAPAAASDLFSVDMRRAALTLSVSVDGLTDGEFAFTGDLGAFSIATANQTGSIVFDDLSEGAYLITMNPPDGFTAGGANCSAGSVVHLGDNELELTVTPGGAADCTFTAIADPQIDEEAIEPVIITLSNDDAGDLTGVSAPLPLVNSGGTVLSFTAMTDVDWLSVTPVSGTIPAAGSVELTISFTDAVLALAPGTHTGNVVVETGAGAGTTSSARSAAGSSQTVSVPVIVSIEPREGTLTLVATTAPMQAGDAVFTYASTIAAFDALALETVNGAASSPSVTVLEGVYQIVQSAPVGWRVNDISCAGGTASANPETGELTVTLAAEQTVVCTFANVRDEDYVRQVTSGAIRAFMVARADRIVSSSPGLIDRLRNPGQGQRNQIRFDMTEGRMNGALNLSLAGMRDGPQRGSGAQPRSDTPFAGAQWARSDEMNPGFNRGGPVEGFGVEHYVWTDADIHNEAFHDWRSERRAERGERAGGYLSPTSREALRQSDQGLDVWMSAAWSSVRDERAGQRTRSNFAIMHVGADLRVHDDLVVGALVQIDQMDTRAGELNSHVEGTGWMAGPYAAARLGSNLYWSGRAAYGRSDNDINPLGLYTDRFNTTRWLFETALAGDLHLGAWRLTPEATVIWFEETQDAYIDTLGITIPSQSISLGRLRAGPEIAYRSQTVAGGYVEPFVRLMLNWDYDGASVLNQAGVLESIGDMRVDGALGVAARFGNGASIELRGHVDGLGAGQFHASTGQVRIRVPF